MTFRFGRFELDESRREFRLGARVLELQPRVFDLFVYLLRNHERVVPKEELLAAIWPDVIVTDSSIMRVVSILRGLLRAGGQADAIQTFSRQGYRFVGELESGGGAARAEATALVRARAAADRNDWQRAVELFPAVPAGEVVTPADLERWAYAALYVGQPNQAVYPLERAVAVHAQNANRRGAARAALTLTNLNLEGCALPIAKGWHRRAATFLADEKEESPEHGLYLWLASRIAMFESDLPRAFEFARQAEALGERVADADVEALGLVYRGHVELATGEIREGLVHMDEAGAATLSGTVGPWVSGIVFCSVIWAYLDRGDLNRAAQWTDQFSRWSRRNTGFGAPGYCRLHRSEVLCVKGDLQEAEAEVTRARELLVDSARFVEGDACRVLGEIRLLRGDLAGAEDAFRQAHERGWNPLPGLAVVQAEKGNPAAAINTLQHGLDSPNWANGQRRGLLLAHLACIAAQAGRVTLARKALADLRRARSLRATAGCEALLHRALAEVAWAEKKPGVAIRALRVSLQTWRDAGSRINAAHVQLRLAELLAATGDAENAALELSSSEKSFATMDAPPMVARCQRVRAGWR